METFKKNLHQDLVWAFVTFTKAIKHLIEIENTKKSKKSKIGKFSVSNKMLMKMFRDR